MPVEAWQLRPALAEDAAALAEVMWLARQHAVGSMPPMVHPHSEVVAYVAGWRFADQNVWLAESEGVVLGFARFPDDWLDSLYVLPSAQGSGIGSALLEVVKQHRPHGFCLWVFQSNINARRFYASRGLVELEHTLGELNEERCPDLRMAWLGSDPETCLQRLRERAVFNLRDAQAHFDAVSDRLV